MSIVIAKELEKRYAQGSHIVHALRGVDIAVESRSCPPTKTPSSCCWSVAFPQRNGGTGSCAF